MSDVRLVEVPTDGYQAAEWLRVRHGWLAQLVCRIAGDSDDWLDEIAEAIAIDGPAHASAWVEYERTHRRPDFDVDEGGYYAWEDAGPANTSRGRAFAVMSGGEQRLVRLVATLNPRVRVPWSIADIGFDERGVDVLTDWLIIVRSQLPNELDRD